MIVEEIGERFLSEPEKPRAALDGGERPPAKSSRFWSGGQGGDLRARASPWLYRVKGFGLSARMERDKGIEPSPRPWQGRVLPLYESRLDKNIYSTGGGERQGADNRARRKRQPNAVRPGPHPRSRCPLRINGPDRSSVHFSDASGLNDGRSFLTLGEMLGALAIDVYSSELLTIVIIDSDLPVLVFAAPVAVESSSPFLLSLDHELASDAGCALSQLRRAHASGNLGHNITGYGRLPSSFPCSKKGAKRIAWPQPSPTAAA